MSIAFLGAMKELNDDELEQALASGSQNDLGQRVGKCLQPESLPQKTQRWSNLLRCERRRSHR